MEIALNGGFGEKGRTSVALRSGASHVLLDAGIKVGASGSEYYPILQGDIGSIDAVLFSHAHEDHVGALSWLLARGYRGRILMTAETLREAPATLADYGEPADVEAFPLPRERIEVIAPGDSFALGDLTVRTGRSGHVVGGVWFAVDDGRERVIYAGDVLPDSAVFLMDEMPACDLLVLDASYGADPVSGAERGAAIAAWIARHRGGGLLPTPLFGRSLELLSVLSGPFAIEAAMRPALEAQLASAGALRPSAVETLRARLGEALDWLHTDRLPDRPLLSDDGMGTAGPSAQLIPLADARGYPTLFTGHLPEGTPGHAMREAGRADWIRMPTHPTLPANVAIWEAAGQPATLGHSCPAPDLAALQEHIPNLRTGARTGQTLMLHEGVLARGRPRPGPSSQGQPPKEEPPKEQLAQGRSK